jgi:hypothetical protein
VLDTGEGIPGWRAISGSCSTCAGHRALLPFATYARLAGPGVVAACDPRLAPPPPRPTALPLDAGQDGDPDALVPQLAAEAALLQARLDWFQLQLGKLTGQGES